MNLVEKKLAGGEYGPDTVRRAYVNSNGIELFDTDPDVIWKFLQIAQHGDHVGYKIGSGMTSFVYGLDSGDVCIKVTSNSTEENRERARLGWSPLRPNLISEAIYMHAVQRRLSRRIERGVNAPRQFAAVQTENGSASLQERIPDRYKSIDELHRTTPYSYERLEQYGNRAVICAKRALMLSGLRFACADLGRPWGISGINPGNILLETGSLNWGGEIRLDSYVIDLVGPLAIQGFIARTTAAFTIS